MSPNTFGRGRLAVVPFCASVHGAAALTSLGAIRGAVRDASGVLPGVAGPGDQHDADCW
jgi:hypothetical protein